MPADETQRLDESPRARGGKFLWLSADLGTTAEREGETLPADASGHVLGDRFELGEQLGKGAMGVVYRARDRTLGRDVALKVLSPDAGKRNRDRLIREGELTAALKHKGIVGIHAGGDQAGVTYLAYELVEGGTTLEDLFSTSSRERLVGLVLEIARAVGHAHQHGVVHRDLKPPNVLIDPDGRARVADFGLAWASGVERLTQTGNLVGTPLYMAPEVMTGAVSGHEPSADVWSLGTILYRALVGRLPFEASTLGQLAALASVGRITPPRSIDRSVSPQLEAVCLKALARDPDRRFANGIELAEALDAALHGNYRERQALTALGLAAGGSLLVAAVALVGVFSLDPTSTPAPTPTRTPKPLPSDPVAAARLLLREGDLARARAAVAAASSAPPSQARLLRAELDLVEGEPLAALERIRDDARLADSPEAAALRSFVRGLPTVAPDAPRGWREGAAKRSLRLGLRGVDWLAWTADARHFQPPAPQLERIRVRTRARLRQALALSQEPTVQAASEAGLGALAPLSERSEHIARALQLDPGSRRARLLHVEELLGLRKGERALQVLDAIGGPRTPQTALLRARLLLDLGRAEEALPDLQQAVGPLQDEPVALALLLRARRSIGPASRARALAERLTLLNGAKRQEAVALLNQLRRSHTVGDELLVGCRRVLALDPLSAGGHYYVGRAVFLRNQVEGVVACATALIREPRLLEDFFRVSVSTLTDKTPGLLDATPARTLMRQFRTNRGQSERLAAALLHAIAVELDQLGGETLVRGEAICDQLLAAEPVWVALVLRALFRIRRKRLLQAREDLDEADLLLPGRGLPLFYRALLEAEERAPLRRVRSLIVQALKLGFSTSREQGWSVRLYPELHRYMDEPEFRIPKHLGSGTPEPFRDRK